VLHYGSVPRVDLARWCLTISGTVEHPFSLTRTGLQVLPLAETHGDIHRVTRGSRLHNRIEGVALEPLMARVGGRPGTRYVLVHAEQGFTTNLPLEDFTRPGNLLALSHEGEPLTPEHGGPVRLLVPTSSPGRVPSG